MRWTLLFILTLAACTNKRQNPTSFSFNEKDYKYGSSHYGDDSVKIGDEYVNIDDPDLKMRKHYADGKKLSVVGFSYKKQRLGPVMFYDKEGKFDTEVIDFTDFDTTGYVYDSEKRLLIKRNP